MSTPDLNLLVTLDVLLAEGSVAGAARRLQLSPSAMSRALARLRDAMGDPLLVRAGRGLVPTPRALELRERIGPLVEEARALDLPDVAMAQWEWILRFTEPLDVDRQNAAQVAAIKRATTENPVRSDVWKRRCVR